MINNGIFTINRRYNASTRRNDPVKYGTANAGTGYIGSVMIQQGAVIGTMIKKVERGSLFKSHVHIYYDKTKTDSGNFKFLVSKLGNDFPYANIYKFSGYITYDCNKKGNTSAKDVASALISRLNEFIYIANNPEQYGMTKEQIQVNTEHRDSINSGSLIILAGEKESDPGTDYKETLYKQKTNPTKEDYSLILYIGVFLGAFMFFYFILRKK